MAKQITPALDENARRYYLDVMGIQCWESLDKHAEKLDDIQTNKDVAFDQSVTDDLSWSQIDTAIQRCDHCSLHKTRKQAIAGQGSRSAELLFILLSPEAGDESANMLAAEANELFAKMLSAINIYIDDVYISSLLKCAVPAQHTVTPHEIQQCENYLRQQIQLMQPKLVVVLGETAIRCLLQKELSLDDFRGQINTGVQINKMAEYEFESVPLFVSYSPQELLRQPENKRKAWSDLQQLQKIIEI